MIKKNDVVENYMVDETYANYVKNPSPSQFKANYNQCYSSEEPVSRVRNTDCFNLFGKPREYIPMDLTKDVSVNEYSSENQNLAGCPIPKTRIKPIIVPPSMDISYWKNDNFYIRSGINTANNENMYKSGYAVTPCDLSPSPNLPPVAPIYTQRYDNSQIIEEYSPDARMLVQDPDARLVNQNQFGVGRGKFKQDDVDCRALVKPFVQGNVNRECGYDVGQLDYGLPVNAPAGNCQKNVRLKAYNEQLSRTPLQPGTVLRSQVEEPYNANMGISYTQQFNPLKYGMDASGQQTITTMDPNIIEPPLIISREDGSPTQYNVYDPRSNGYGSDNRSYVDNVTGQPRFYYDDVEGVRRPNYITRNKIDHTDILAPYGIMQERGKSCSSLENCARQAAENDFLVCSLQQREAFTQPYFTALNNKIGYQRKIAPLSRASRSSVR